MAIPLDTTTIAVWRPPVDEDPYETTGDSALIVSGVRAVVSTPRGTDRVVPGDQSVVDMHLTCDPCDLQSTDYVIDSSTGINYSVVWISERPGFGMDHLEGGLRVIAVAGGTTDASGLAIGGVVA